MSDELDSLDDVLLPSSTTNNAQPSKFRPKTRAKAVKPAPRITESSNKLPGVGIKPAPRTSDSSNKSPELEASIPEDFVSDSVKEQHLQPDVEKAEDIADMVFVPELIGNSVQPASNNARIIGKLQPNSVPCSVESIIPSAPITSSSALESVSYGLHVTQGLPHAAVEPMIHEEATQDQAQDLESKQAEGIDPNLVIKETCISDVYVSEKSLDRVEASSSEIVIIRDEKAESFRHDQEKSVEVADICFSMECLENLLGPVSISGVVGCVVGSDHSSCSPASRAISSDLYLNGKEIPPSEDPVIHAVAEGKSVSLLPPDAVEPVPLNEEREGSASKSAASKAMDQSFTQLIDGGDDPLFPCSTISNVQIDDVRQKDSSDFSELESVENFLAESTSTRARSVGKFDSKRATKSRKGDAKTPLVSQVAIGTTTCQGESDPSETAGSAIDSSAMRASNTISPDLSQEQAADEVTSTFEAALPLDVDNLQQLDEAFGQDVNLSLFGVDTLQTARAVRKFCPKPATRSTKGDAKTPLVSQVAVGPTTCQMESHPMETAGSAIDPTMWAPNTISPDLSQEQATVRIASTFEAALPLDEGSLKQLDGVFGQDQFNCAKRKPSDVFKDYADQAVASFNMEETTHASLEERPPSEIVEDGVEKLTRKLRKRINVPAPTSELDDRLMEDWDVGNSSCSLIDEEHNEEYTSEDMSKQKRATTKSKRQAAENKKSGRRSEKVHAEPASNIEPPVKKKFSHGTRRGKRQVDKVLLETPEEEIDTTQISIKNLIWLAEARERNSNKDEAVSGNPHSGERLLNYHSYMNKEKSARWSKSETELFYQAIRQFGTDFAMIQQLFPTRTRHQVKLKFKNEERKHPLQIADAVSHRSKDHFHFELVIQQLQAKAEKNSRKDATGDPVAASEDVVGDDEIQDDIRKPEKEQLEANAMEHEIQSPKVFNEWEGEDHSSVKFSGYEDGFEWDANASSPHEMDNYTYERF